jgi:hypothetical protein
MGQERGVVVVDSGEEEVVLVLVLVLRLVVGWDSLILVPWTS